MKFIKYFTAASLVLSMGVVSTSCVDDLDVKPDDPNTKTELTDAAQWQGYFGSLYGLLRYEGNLSTSDGGAGTWMRCHWNLQEITADEAIISNKWNDPGYHTLNFNTWLTENEWIYAAFAREFYTAKQCSEFIAKSQGALSFGFTQEEIDAMTAEARVLRAYAYYYMIDLFGRGPWITEDTPTGATPPTYDRKQLFDATVADLKATIESGKLIPASRQDKMRLSLEAAQTLLSKLYLNAEVYVGTPMYKECADVLKEVKNSIGSLAPEYKYIFCGSNEKYVHNEIIFAIPQRANSIETWGGTTYMTAGAFDELADPFELARLGCGFVDFDVKKDPETNEEYLSPILSGPNPWTGLRMRPELSQMLIQNGGKRNLAYTEGYNIGVANLDKYGPGADGYMCVKYSYTNESNYDNVGSDAPYQLNRYYLIATDAFKAKFPQTQQDRLAAAQQVLANYPDEFAGYTAQQIMDGEAASVQSKLMAQYKAEFERASQVCDAAYPVFRLADVYLMLSECEFRGVDGADPGFVLFNKVRERAGLQPNNNPSALDILNERQCELYWEGHRRSDLIRFGRYTGSSYNWSWRGGVLEGAYMPDFRKLFAIPYQYVPTVGQNPGY